MERPLSGRDELFWDHDGLCIWYKRLEAGTFQMLTTTNDPEGIEIEYGQLVQLLDGIDLNTGRRRRRYPAIGTAILVDRALRCPLARRPTNGIRHDHQKKGNETDD